MTNDGHMIDDPMVVVGTKPDFEGLGLDNFKQKIIVDHNVQDMMKIDYIHACSKLDNGRFCYMTMDEGGRIDNLLFEGDIMIQTYEGKWIIIRKE